jgi:pimeloyl-ACP methyl ester carboxylesterase
VALAIEKPLTGYDPATSAKDLHSFIVALGLSSSGGVDIVTHDVGTWIAYAHVSAFTEDIRRLVLTEAAIPGVCLFAQWDRRLREG